MGSYLSIKPTAAQIEGFKQSVLADLIKNFKYVQLEEALDEVSLEQMLAVEEAIRAKDKAQLGEIVYGVLHSFMDRAATDKALEFEEDYADYLAKELAERDFERSRDNDLMRG